MRQLLAIVAAASLLSMPAMAQGNGKAYGKANTNEHTRTVVNGATVMTHTVTNPAMTMTQVRTAPVKTMHIHKMKVKARTAKRMKMNRIKAKRITRVRTERVSRQR
jgi:hypothetical protein